MQQIGIVAFFFEQRLHGQFEVEKISTDSCFSLLTFLLTPWSRVLLEKPTGLKLVKKFPTFYGTQRFITAFNFCVSMHHYIWVYQDQLDANCLVLFYYTFCSTCFGCSTHPSSGASYNVHADGTGKCTCELTRSTPCLASNSARSQTRRGTGQLTRALTCIICMYII